MRFYADVHRKRDDTGYRITYTTDGENFRHVDSPSEIPVEAGDKVYVDTIPIIHTDGFIELLRRGAEVYYLRRLTMIEAVRQKMGIKSKSARTDIKALMAVDDKWFRRVDENFLVMRQMISAFRSLERTMQRLENQLKAASSATEESLRRMVKQVEIEKEVLAKLISEEAAKRFPVFVKVVKELGIMGENHVLACEALAELLTYVDFSKSFRQVRGYLRLYRKRSKNQTYNHETRHALTRLTMATTRNTPNAHKQEDILMKIWLTIRQETQERLAGIPAQQQG
ncbi:MAG: hypothetical protein QXD24_03875 [Candidatus Caldarchaeum sp.]